MTGNAKNRKTKLWEDAETIRVLKYLINHFNDWVDNPKRMVKRMNGLKITDRSFKSISYRIKKLNNSHKFSLPYCRETKNGSEVKELFKEFQRRECERSKLSKNTKNTKNRSRQVRVDRNYEEEMKDNLLVDLNQIKEKKEDKINKYYEDQKKKLEEQKKKLDEEVRKRSEKANKEYDVIIGLIQVTNKAIEEFTSKEFISK